MNIKSAFDYFNEIVSKYKVAKEKLEQAFAYLHYYGYLVKSGEIKDYSIEEIINAVRQFQAVFGIETDGECGPETLTAMQYPRCAIKDNVETEEINGWAIKNLTYFIKSKVRQFEMDEFAAIIAKSFQNWSDVCNLTFERVGTTSKANVIIDTGNSPRESFGQQGGTLAWAELSGSNAGANDQRLMKLDLSEIWKATNSTARGTKLENVCTHETGHLLNLNHSKVSSALMAPFYAEAITLPQLNDDIKRIQSIYGKPVVKPDPVPLPPTPPPGPLPNPTETTKITLEVKGIEKIEVPGWRISKIQD